MKRKIIIFLLIVVCITGCGKKKNTEIDIELEKGLFTTICKTNQDFLGATAEVTTTTNYGADKYVINYKIKTVYQFSDYEQFEFNAEETKNNAPQYQSDTDSYYSYSIDNDNKTVTTLFAYKKLNLSEELKNSYIVDNYIKDFENNGAICEFIGITRNELGL